jgi:NADPH:quinone reductase-like Zn-dependent oxidoreductase
VAAPPAGELGALGAQAREQRDERRISGPEIVGGAELRDDARRLLGPRRAEHRARRGREQQVHEDVAIFLGEPAVAEQPLGGAVPVQDVPAPPGDVGGLGQIVDEPLQRLGDALALEGAPLGGAGQRAQVGVLDVGEAQGPGQRVDGGGRRADAAPLLEADVPVDADAGERGDLLAAQAGRAPAARGQAEVDGTWAEQVRVPTENAIRLGAADALEPAEAPRWTTLGAALVPFGGLTAAQLAAGETVVINGATGNFGAAGVAVALAMGAGCVLATGRNRAVLARLHERFGARVRPVPMSGDEAVDRQRILDAAPGPIDCVLDLLPPAATAAQVRAALTTVRPGGRVVLMGGLPHDVPVSYAWLMRNNVTLRGQWMYARESIPRALQLVRAGLLSLDTVQLKTFALREVNEAIAHAAAHGGPFDGVVICP